MTFDIASFGSYSQRPVAGNAGARFIVSDAQIAQWCDDGTAWRPLLDGQVLGIEPPLSGTFVGYNQSTSTIQQLSGSLLVTGVNDGASIVNRGFALSYATTSTSYVEAALQCIPSFGGSGCYTIHSIGMRYAVTAASYMFGITVDHNLNTWNLQSFVFSNDSTYSTYYAAGAMCPLNGPLVLRVRRNSTNIVSEYSRDRIIWVVFETRTMSSIFSSSTPNQVFISVSGYNLVPRCVVTHFSYGTL